MKVAEVVVVVDVGCVISAAQYTVFREKVLYKRPKERPWGLILNVLWSDFTFWIRRRRTWRRLQRSFLGCDVRCCVSYYPFSCLNLSFMAIFCVFKRWPVFGYLGISWILSPLDQLVFLMSHPVFESYSVFWEQTAIATQ